MPEMKVDPELFVSPANVLLKILYAALPSAQLTLRRYRPSWPMVKSARRQQLPRYH